MKKYLAFALALIMALALIPGAALADKAAGTAAMAVAAGDPEKEVIPAVAAVIPAVSRAAT